MCLIRLTIIRMLQFLFEKRCKSEDKLNTLNPRGAKNCKKLLYILFSSCQQEYVSDIYHSHSTVSSEMTDGSLVMHRPIY